MKISNVSRYLAAAAAFAKRATTGAVGSMALIAFTLAPSAQAQDEAEAGRAIVAMEDAAGAKLSVTRSARTGLATFITAPAGRFIPVPDGRATTASARGLSFIDQYGGAFGLRGRGSVEVTSVQKDELGIEHVRMQQMVSGVPVTGGELIVHMKGNRVLAANGKTAPGLDDFLVVPAVASNEALNAVRDLVTKHLKSPNAVLSEPRLEVLDQGLLNGRAFPRRLAWFVEARGENLREFVWIDASNRMTLLRFSQLSHARNRFIHNGNSASALPGTLMRTEGGAATGDVDADRAYDFSGHTYDYFFSNHGRDSYDGAGAPLVSTVHHCRPADELQPCPYPNAFWNGQQMVYGNGFSSADDVVAHELTHAVVERSASLFYYMQSGALNESFADIFGETVDLLNGAGNDDVSVRWHMGEDLTGIGAIRNMMTPTAFGDPGKMSDPQFKCETDPVGQDLGGVHGNSGVPNHAYALMVDGGTYNGITVTGIGLAKAAKIQYRALTRYLVSSSDFLDNYNALQFACADLVGTAGITGANCAEVKDALDAVQMANPWPCSADYGVNAAVPALCSAGKAPLNTFFDGFETGLGNWSVSGTVGTPGPIWSGPIWSRTSESWGPNAFATGGTDSVWGYNQWDMSDARLSLASNQTIPVGARLQFNHSFGFENYLSDTFDGGVFEYSTDGGATWASMASLHAAGAAYNGTLLPGTGNPLAGQAGFVKDSFGFTASQYNLLPLVGQAQVRFRFRVGTDPSVDDYGWFIDDFRIYTCVDIATMASPAPGSTLTGPSETFTWNGVAGATEYWLGVGYTPGGTEIYGASQGTSLSRVITGLPIDGRAVHVRLWSRTGGQWLYTDYTYTSAALPALVCPATVNPGGSIAVQVFGGATATDWVAVHPDGAANTSYSSWVYVPLPRPQTVNLTAPATPGNYDIRLFAANSTTVVLGACDIAVFTPPTLSVSDVTVFEGNAGTSNATFTVSLSPAAGGTVTVAYATANGTATSGSDYASTAGTLTFAAGETSKTVSVTVNGDTTAEANETFVLNLSSPTGGAVIGDAQGIGTIATEDAGMTCPASVTPGGTIAAQVFKGAVATDWVAVYPDGGETFTTWAYAPIPRPQTVNLTAPATPGNYDIRFWEDNRALVLLGSCDIVVATAPTLSVNDASVAEGNAGTSNATFTVSLAPAAAGTVTVAYATANGTATSGSDYVAATGTLTFAAGETSKTVVVQVNGDTTFEPNESFTLNLTSPTGGALIGDGQGAGTITNDDPLMTCPATVNPGGSIAVQVFGGAAATDWVAVHLDGAANTSYLSWVYVPLPRPQTVNLTAPATPGNYDIRLFAANSTTVVLAACDIAVVTSPTLSVSDVTVFEGNAGTSNATFTVSLSPAAGGTVTVAYATANGTATSGSDYASTAGTLTFAAGETSKTVSVTVNGDTTAEANETFVLNLSSPTGGAVIGDAQGIGTIATEDAGMTCPASVTPGGTIAAQVFKGAVATDWVAVYPDGGETFTTWAYAPIPRPQTVNLTAPATPGNYDIRFWEDNRALVLLGSCDIVVATAPTLSVNDASVAEGNAGTSNATFTVSLAPAAAGTVTVAYATANGTATSGSDYVAATGTLTFAAGETSKTVVVQVNGDTTFEPNESFTLNLTSPTGGALIGDGQGAGTITNDDPLMTCPATVNPGGSIAVQVFGGAAATDWVAVHLDGAANTSYLSWVYVPLPRPQTVNLTAPATPGNYDIRLFAANSTTVVLAACDIAVVTSPTLSVSDVTVFEGNAGTSNATFTVSLSPAAGGTVTVAYATANGTATSGSDYASTAGTLTFAAGETSKTVSVTVNGDTTAEANETFVLNLSSPTGGAVIGDAQGIGTIATEDAGMTCPASVTPGGTIAVQVFKGAVATDWVAVYPDGGETFTTWAYAPIPRPQTVNLTAPATPGNYDIRFWEDNRALVLLGSCDIVVATAPTLSVNDASVTEGNAGTSNATFTVSLAPAAAGTVTVAYATANGTATSGSDYVAATGTLTFAAGETSKTVVVQVNGDTTFEPNESFTLNLTSPTGGALIGDGQGAGTITNDDPLMTCPATAPTGGSIAVQVFGGVSATDWVAVHPDGAANTSYSSWVYVPLPRPQTVNLTAPATPGNYDIRLFAENSTTVVLAACDIVVFTPPTLSVNDVTVTEGNSGTVDATFTVSLSPAAAGTVTVAYATANGTAAAGSDYSTTTGTLTFSAGQTSKTVVVPVIGDATSEANETFALNLSSPTGGAVIGDAQGVGTITNDDIPAASLSIDDVTVTEGNSGTTNANFTVTLAPAAAGTVTVNYATANGTATSGAPATATNSNTTSIATNDNASGSPYPSSITVGALSATVTKVTVTLNSFSHTYPDDVDILLVGPAGQKVLLMSDAGGGTDAVGLNLTFDDQAANPLPGTLISGTFKPTDVTDGSGDDIFAAPAPAGPYASALSVFNGQNPAGVWSLYVRDDTGSDTGSIASGWSLSITTQGDYTPASGTLTFTAGQTTKTVTVPVLGDLLIEGNETFTVGLSGASGASISDATGVGTITNDDCTDTDGDRLCDSVETNTGIFVSASNTGTNPAVQDSDGDGLKDGDEVLGTLAGLNLPAMGTNPVRQNIIMEHDWMDDATGCSAHTHRPTQAMLDRVAAAFLAAPNVNLDGSTGITVINDFGQGGAFTGGNLIADADGNIDGGVNDADFAAKKTANIAANRHGYVYYVLHGHTYGGSNSSGQAELPGDDLIVTLGCSVSLNNVSNTIMHELGHNLNLQHGGNESCNWKPNYNSVMNYRFQFPGVDTTGSCNAVGSSGESNTLDYSRGTRISLNENALNENFGTCGATAIDWNFVNGLETSLAYDLNRTATNGNSGTVDNGSCGGTLTTLNDHNDWANMSFAGLTNGDGALLGPRQVVSCQDQPKPPAPGIR